VRVVDELVARGEPRAVDLGDDAHHVLPGGEHPAQAEGDGGARVGPGEGDGARRRVGDEAGGEREPHGHGRRDGPRALQVDAQHAVDGRAGAGVLHRAVERDAHARHHGHRPVHLPGHRIDAPEQHPGRERERRTPHRDDAGHDGAGAVGLLVGAR
jgi:hypothetical protein